VDFLDNPVRIELDRARPGLLHLLRNGRRGVRPTALVQVVNSYLRLKPNDTEVREARDRLSAGHVRG
jgi:hypothetical protein